MVLSTSTVLGHHHLSPVTKDLNYTPSNPCSLRSCSPFTHASGPRQPPHCFLSLWISLFQTFHRMESVTFCVWLLWFVMFPRFILGKYQHFVSFYGWIIVHCVASSQCVSAFICWWACEMFPSFGYCGKCCWGIHVEVFNCSPVFNSFWYLPKKGIEFLDHMTILFEEPTFLYFKNAENEITLQGCWET